MPESRGFPFKIASEYRSLASSGPLNILEITTLSWSERYSSTECNEKSREMCINQFKTTEELYNFKGWSGVVVSYFNK